jgi:hypothetical protein
MDGVHFPIRNVRLGAGALVLVLLLTACGGGGKHSSSSSTTTQPKVAAIKTSVLKVGSVDVESAGATTPPIPTSVGKAVLNGAQGYLDDALFGPLKNGQVGAAYASHFDSGVKPTATGHDRATLTNEGIGKIDDLKTTATPVLLSALDGTLGELMYVATNFDVTETGKTDTGNVSITHHVELTFAPVGRNWLVTAYRVQAVRKLPAGTTTTTAKAGASS